MTDVKELADRPAIKECDIVVTPEMIEAGLGVLSPSIIIDLRDGWIRPSVVAERVFRAMFQVSK
jgi:hypothetical protein